MLEILTPVHGEILNRMDGKETSNGLEIEVTGLAAPGDTVKINGKPVTATGQCFRGTAVLKDIVNTISVSASGNRGDTLRTIKVLYDRCPFPRANFCIDDNIFFLRDLAKEKPRSLFNHFYLKRLWEMHEKYDLKLTLNLFFRDSRSGFTLQSVPDHWKNEWKENSDWLKLAFHAASEFPDRIYQNAETAELTGDMDVVEKEILRFAGPDSLIAPPNIHWSMVKPEAVLALKKRGCNFLGGLFLNGQTRIGENMGTIPLCDVGYYENEENSRLIQQKHLWHDFRYGITMGTECAVLNLEELPQLKKNLESLLTEPHNRVFHILTHEQYFFPEYEQYLPDHFDRLELMASMIAEHGYKFVFFNQGFLGYCEN